MKENKKSPQNWQNCQKHRFSTKQLGFNALIEVDAAKQQTIWNNTNKPDKGIEA